MFELRDYQKDASNAMINFIRSNTNPCLAELATGAGKSLIVADVAKRVHEMSGKKILCLAPSKELIEQNYLKFIDTGTPASFYSAAMNCKSVRHAAVFGTPKSVLNGIDKFLDGFAAVILDECHKLDPTTKTIIAKMREANPNVRVAGLTATPFRLGDGYIYDFDVDGKQVEQANNPFFKKLVYKIQTQELIDKGFLTKPVLVASDRHYEAGALELNKQNKFDEAEVAKVFEGKGRLTSEIVADVVSRSDPRFGVMFFGASIAHCEEIASSLPADQTAVVTGNTKKQDRKKLLDKFKSGELRYIVNRDVLTTGFDAPNVGAVAILRPTESAGLLLQIIGRGLRLFEGKEVCMVLDYAENFTRHYISSDNLNPEIMAKGKSIPNPIDIICPACSHLNTFSAKPNKENMPIDASGIFLDAFGDQLKNEAGIPIAAHHGQRCQKVTMHATDSIQCGHRWNSRLCPECNAENSLTARFCGECHAELVNPNDKLVLRDAVKLKKKMDKQKELLTGKVIDVTARLTQNAVGIIYSLESGQRVEEYVNPDRTAKKFIKMRTDQIMGQFGLVNIRTRQAIVDAFDDNRQKNPHSIVWIKKEKFVEIKERRF